MLTEHAAEAERLRKPTDAVIDALRDARIFDLMLPRAHGAHAHFADSPLHARCVT